MNVLDIAVKSNSIYISGLACSSPLFEPLGPSGYGVLYNIVLKPQLIFLERYTILGTNK